MNKFTSPTLEERIEYKKKEDEKLKKRIEESVEKLDKELKEARERLDRVAIGLGFSPSYFSKENIEKRERKKQEEKRKKELERLQIRKEIEQELRKEYEQKYKILAKKYGSSSTIGESKIESLSLFSYKGSPITRHSGGSLPMMSPLYEPTSCYPSNNYDCCKLFDEMAKNPNYAHWLVQVGNPSCSDGPSWECGSLGNY